ncbi:MAG: SMC family ATPase, partial [Myxococcota bacterium]
MRPVRLELEGITCFRERQQVEFDGLSLFAISGPTGAGKSSLLDAMVLALYGQVPRMGKHGLSELISLGADRGGVVFDYEVGGQRWRVGRRLRRGGATAAQLERIDADGVRAVAEGVREVDERIAATLGLGSDAFLRAVVLPQGRFDVFLRSPPSKQQEILTELLRLQVYDRMQQAATAGLAARKGRLDWLDQRRTELGAASEDAVAEAVADAANAADAVERAVAERERAAADLAERERRRVAWDTLDRVERDRAAHLAAVDELAALAAGLDRSRLAAELTPGLDALDALARDEARLASALGAAHTRRQQVEREEEEAVAAYDRAAADASGAPAARGRIEALTEVLGAVTARESARKRAGAHRSHERQLRSDAAAHAARATAAGDELTRLERERAGWAPVPFDPAEWARLEALRAPAAAAGAARAEAARLATDATRLGLAAAEAAHAAAAAEPAAAAASDVVADAEQRVAAAQRAVHAARAAHTASTLRHQLVEGEPCPVCAQRVAEVPAGGAAPDTSAAEAELALAEREDRAARSGSAAALQALTRARGAAEGAADTARLAEESRVAACARLAALEAALGGFPGDGPVEGRVVAELRRVGALAEAHAKAEREAQRWEAEAAARRAELAAAEAAATAAAGSADREAQGAAEADAEVATADEQIRAVTAHPDPRVERDEWKARVDQWTAAVDGASVRRDRAVEARARAAADRDAAEAAAIAAAAARAEAEAAIGERLRGHGFADPAEARRAAWEAAKRTAAELRLRAYHLAGARLDAAHAEAVAVAGST